MTRAQPVPARTLSRAASNKKARLASLHNATDNPRRPPAWDDGKRGMVWAPRCCHERKGATPVLSAPCVPSCAKPVTRSVPMPVRGPIPRSTTAQPGGPVDALYRANRLAIVALEVCANLLALTAATRTPRRSGTVPRLTERRARHGTLTRDLLVASVRPLRVGDGSAGAAGSRGESLNRLARATLAARAAVIRATSRPPAATR
jgi:hypothetical protein